MATSNEPPELPGYYFDRERNRYFRLLPGTNNHNPLTTQMISNRQADAETVVLKTRKRHNLAEILQKRSVGKKRRGIFEIDCINCKLNSYTGGDVILQRSYPLGTVCKIQPDSCNERLFEYIADNNHSGQYYGVLRKHDDVFRVTQNSRYLSLCFPQNSRKVMYTDLIATKVTLLDTFSREELSVHCPSPQTCACAVTNRYKYSASCNSGTNAVLISNTQAFFRNNSVHLRGGPGHTMVCLQSTIMCQHFSQTSPIHFNGLRGGTVVGLDLRNLRRNWHSCKLRSSARCNPDKIYALRDDHSVLIGYDNPDAVPTLSLWDLRFHKAPVLQFCTTLIRRPKIETMPLFSLNVDDLENVVTSVLPDCRARFWSLKTGEILKTHPSKEEKEKFATAATYANNWKMMKGKMGALVYIVEPTYEGYEFLDI